MKIEWAAICRYAESTDANGTTAVGLHAWWSAPVEVPWEATLYLVLSFVDLTDFPAINGVACQITGPDGTVVLDESWPVLVEVISADPLPEGAEPRHAYSLGVTFTAERPGRHEVRLTAGEGSVTLGYVVQAKE